MSDETAEPVLSNYAKDRTGERCGMLVAVRPLVLTSHGWRWLYRCDCGGEYEGYSFSAKVTQHCGCLTESRRSAMNVKHGMAGSREYKVWAAMKDRCGNPDNKHYARYGGRGLRVCDEWIDSFETFILDMGPRGAGMSIERIDNSLGYFASNCRWATRKEQQNNRECNRVLSVNGEKRTLKQWSEAMGICHETIRGRLRRGWPVERAVSQPANPRHRNSRCLTKTSAS